MAEPTFDKDGNLTNVAELTAEEVASAYQEKNKALFGRLTEAEQREAQAKADKAKAEQDLAEAKKAPPAPAQDPDELRLIAKGLSDEELAEAKDIAKGKGISLVEAIKSKTFLLFQKDFREEQEKEKAKLGASKGSGQGEQDEDAVAPGLTAEQHKEQWKKKQGIK